MGGGGVTLDYVRGASLIMLSSGKGSQKRKSEGGWRVMCFGFEDRRAVLRSRQRWGSPRSQSLQRARCGGAKASILAQEDLIWTLDHQNQDHKLTCFDTLGWWRYGPVATGAQKWPRWSNEWWACGEVLLWDGQKLGGNMWVQMLLFPLFHTKFFWGDSFRVLEKLQSL